MLEFRDDDPAYVDWIGAYPNGHVINIARGYNPSDARVHRANCRWITGQISRGVTLTGPYVKGCAETLDELALWPTEQVREQILPCRTCSAAPNPNTVTSTKLTQLTQSPPQPNGRWDIDGPTNDLALVQAWADDYIRFERRPPWQVDLRNEIRSRCRQLEPSDGQVLHATFAGDKRPNADVENLVLYYIDSFAASGRNGIRFEYGAAVPSAPDETRYAFGYRYALASRTATFSDWEPVRKFASFDWITLKGFDGEKKQAKVWLEVSRALVRGEVEVFESALPGTPFAVRVQLRPPHQRTPVWGNLVKEVFDGVICAFQAHIDIGGLDAVVARLATYLPAGIDEIRRLLIDQHRAVLGAVPQLIRVYRSGVKWDPADHWCVAGELAAAERDAPTGLGWAIKGDIVELARPQSAGV